MDEKKAATVTAPTAGSLTVEPELPKDIPTLQAMLKAERMRNAEMAGRLAVSVPMKLTYQMYIASPPRTKEQMWTTACANDKTTSESWRSKWLDHIERNVKENKADERMVDGMLRQHAYKPCLCVASGPSLNRNFMFIKMLPKEIPVISVLHNYHRFIDTDTRCDAFVTLDAGDIVIKEMAEGGSKTPEEYWESTKNQTLITGLVTPPELVKKWKGKVYFFSATIPDEEFMVALPKLTKNKWVYSVGGHTFGAAMYHAAWIWGCSELALVGADYAFDYMHQFHPWKTDYDKKFFGVMPCTDVWGNRVYSWPSYQNFRAWVEFQAMGGNSDHHVRIVNCTEGGTVGAYPEGNIMQVQQLLLKDWVDQHARWQKYQGEVVKRSGEGDYVIGW